MKLIIDQIKKFQTKWQLNTWRTIIILLVFSFTGISSVIVKNFLANLLWGNNINFLYYLSYPFMFLPIYYLLLIFYGTVLGEFVFFWHFTKRPVILFKKLFLSSK